MEGVGGAEDGHTAGARRVQLGGQPRSVLGVGNLAVALQNRLVGMMMFRNVGSQAGAQRCYARRQAGGDERETPTRTQDMHTPRRRRWAAPIA